MEKFSPKREIYAEVLRLIAAFTVVFQHTVTSAWYWTPVHSDNFLTLNFLNSLSRFGVGIFIMISGAFMLSPKYPHSPQKIIKQNLTKILKLIVFWVILYGIINTITAGKNFLEIFKTPLLLITKPQTHLWFLYTIAGLYIITPALRVFTEHASRRLIFYTIAVFFTFGLVFPTLNHLLTKFVDFPLYQNLGIRGCTTFAGFYLTGFYIAHYGVSALGRKVLYAATIFSWLIALIYSTRISLIYNAPNEYFFGNLRPTTFLMAAGIFCFFHNHFNNRWTENRLLCTLSQCMLGVYLIHPLFIKIFYGLQYSILKPHPMITAPLMAILFFLLSLAAVYLLRHIPFLKKFL